jgi:hypothetical protein
MMTTFVDPEFIPTINTKKPNHPQGIEGRGVFDQVQCRNTDQQRK